MSDVYFSLYNTVTRLPDVQKSPNADGPPRILITCKSATIFIFFFPYDGKNSSSYNVKGVYFHHVLLRHSDQGLSLRCGLMSSARRRGGQSRVDILNAAPLPCGRLSTVKTNRGSMRPQRPGRSGFPHRGLIDTVCHRQ